MPTISSAPRQPNDAPIPVGGPARDQSSWKSLAREPSAVALVIVVVIVDVLLLVGNVVYYATNDPGEPVTRFGDPDWNGALDGSFVEIIGHVQVIATVVVLLVVAVVRRGLVHAAWALAFAGLFLDDFLQVHERLGSALAGSWGLPAVAGLRSVDVGEIVVWAGEAVLLGLVVVIATMGSDGTGRRDSLVLLGCMVVIAVFGVGVDQVHSVLEPHVSHVVGLAVTLTETAGELLGMSLALLAAASMSAATAATLRVSRQGAPSLRGS